MTAFGLPLPLPRTRVRTLLILVAVVAFAIEGAREGARWLRFRDRYRISVQAERRHRQAASERQSQAGVIDRQADSAPAAEVAILRRMAETHRREARGFRSLADWSRGLASKYELALRTPWRDVPADPPYRADESTIGVAGW